MAISKADFLVPFRKYSAGKTITKNRSVKKLCQILPQKSTFFAGFSCTIKLKKIPDTKIFFAFKTLQAKNQQTSVQKIAFYVLRSL